MNAFIAAFLSMQYIPNGSGPQFLAGYHHSPAPYKASAVPSACKTAWGKRYPVGEQLQLGGLTLRCDYMSTWQDGRYKGDSVRWVVSSR